MTEKPGTEDKTTISTPSATSPNVDMKVRRFSYFWIRKRTRFQNDLAFTVNNIFNILSYKLRGWNFTIAQGELANKDRIIWKLLVTSALLSCHSYLPIGTSRVSHFFYQTSTNKQLTANTPGEAKEQGKANELSWKLTVTIVVLGRPSTILNVSYFLVAWYLDN